MRTRRGGLWSADLLCLTTSYFDKCNFILELLYLIQKFELELPTSWNWWKKTSNCEFDVIIFPNFKIDTFQRTWPATFHARSPVFIPKPTLNWERLWTRSSRWISFWPNKTSTPWLYWGCKSDSKTGRNERERWDGETSKIYYLEGYLSTL